MPKRTRIPVALAVVSLLSVTLGGGIGAATPPAVGPGQPVLGPVSIQGSPPDAQVRADACAAVGECVAGGTFADRDGGHPAFLATMTGGTWGRAAPVAFPDGVQDPVPDATVTSVACGAVGACVAGGQFADATGGHQAFVVTMSGGVWGTAVPVTYSVTQDALAGAGVRSVSCVAAGECVAGGYVTTDAAGQPAFVLTMTGGVWGTAQPVTFTGGVENATANAATDTVSCGALGVCVGGGYFVDVAGAYRAFVVRLQSGAWGTAAVVTFSIAENATPDSSVASVACTSATACVAGGNVLDASGYRRAYVLTMTSGTWGTGTPVGFAGGVESATPDSEVRAVDCGATDECVAGGRFTDALGGNRAFVVTMTGGTWGTGEPVTYTGGESSSPDAVVQTVSCGASGACVGGGRYHDAADDFPAFVITMTGGTWGTAEPVTFGAGVEDPGPDARTRAVACGGSGACIAGGEFSDADGDPEAFLAVLDGGTWGTATPVAFATVGVIDPDAQVRTTACTAVGECIAGGFSDVGAAGVRAFVMTMTGGVWGVAELVTYSVAEAAVADARVSATACRATGECVAAGKFLDGSGNQQAFVMTMTGGVWGVAEPVTYSVAAAPDPSALTFDVACSSAGTCVAVGAFFDGSGLRQAFVLTESGGVWGVAEPVTYSVAVAADPAASARTVACPADDTCVVGGRFAAASGGDRAYVLPVAAGVPGTATPVAFGAGVENATPTSFLADLSCAAVGVCVGGGYFLDPDGYYRAYLVTTAAGDGWAPATPVTFPGGIENAAPDSFIESVACAAPGECVAGGGFLNLAGESQMFVMTMTAGRWGVPVPVAFGAGVADPGLRGFLSGVACTGVGECVAAGRFTDAAGDDRAFVLLMTGGVWGTAAPVAFTVPEAAEPESWALAVGCATGADCAVGGLFTSAADQHPAFVLTVTGARPDPVPEPTFTG